MNSIGQMASAAYYLQSQASHRSPAEYYIAGKEPNGAWVNPTGMFDLPDGGAIDPRDFERLHAGFSPDGLTSLTRNAGSPDRSPGFDMTFSADKSISALWALSPPETRETIEALAVEAARVALQETVLRHCATTRLRVNGEIEIHAADLMGATFLHRTSRENDPQLHVHCPIFNIARTHSDGRFRAHHQYPVYAWGKAAGALFRAHLAHGLQRELGVAMERHDEGGRFTRVKVGEEIAEHWNSLLAHWSKRRRQIVALAGELGIAATGDARGMQRATLITRARKHHGVTTGDDCQRWREEAQFLGVTVEALQAAQTAVTPEPEAAGDEARLRALAAELEALPGELTRQEAVFRLPDLVEAVAIASATTGSPAAISTAVQRLLRDSRVVALEKPQTSAEARAGMAHTRRYSTRSTLEMERAVRDTAARLARDSTGGVGQAAIEAKLARLGEQGYPLSGEQSRAIRHLAGAGRIAIVEGAAGSGKTTTLRPLADLHREQGRTILPAAIAWRTAVALGDDLGARPFAVDKMLKLAARGALTVDADTVIVLDEAGLLSTRQMHHVLRLAEATGAALVLAGDTQQQQPVEAGPGLRLAREAVGSVRVDKIRRQKADIEDVLVQGHGLNVETARLRAAMMPTAEAAATIAAWEARDDKPEITPWQVAVSEAFRDGAAETAIEALHARGRFHLGHDETATLERLVADWAGHVARHPGAATVVLARSHAERRAPSALMRERLLGPDRAPGVVVEVAGGAGGSARGGTGGGTRDNTAVLEIAPGDRLRIGATQWDKQLFNGTVVIVDTVRAVPQAGGGRPAAFIEGHLENGRKVAFRHDEIRDYRGQVRLDHGYALTIAAAQGLTVDRAFLLADAAPARETIYPAATRHRERLDIYVNRQPLNQRILEDRAEDARDQPVSAAEVRAHLARLWSRGGEKEAASDHLSEAQRDLFVEPPAGERRPGDEAGPRPRPQTAEGNVVARLDRQVRQRAVLWRHGAAAGRLDGELASLAAGYERYRARRAGEGDDIVREPGFGALLARHRRLLGELAPFREGGRDFAALRAAWPRLAPQALRAFELQYERAAGFRDDVIEAATTEAATRAMDSETRRHEMTQEPGNTGRTAADDERRQEIGGEPGIDPGAPPEPMGEPAISPETRQRLQETQRAVRAHVQAATAAGLSPYVYPGHEAVIARYEALLALADLPDALRPRIETVLQGYRDGRPISGPDPEAPRNEVPAPAAPPVEPAPVEPPGPSAEERYAALAGEWNALLEAAEREERHIFETNGHVPLLARVRDLVDQPGLTAAHRETLQGLLAAAGRDRDAAAQVGQMPARTAHLTERFQMLEAQARQAGHYLPATAGYAAWKRQALDLIRDVHAALADPDAARHIARHDTGAPGQDLRPRLLPLLLAVANSDPHDPWNRAMGNMMNTYALEQGFAKGPDTLRNHYRLFDVHLDSLVEHHGPRADHPHVDDRQAALAHIDDIAAGLEAHRAAGEKGR